MQVTAFTVLAGLLAPASALRGLPISIAELAKQVKTGDQFSTLAASYPEYNLSVPVDHFHNESRYEPHSNNEFNLRYWFDAQFYEPGGPVFVLSGGETNGEGRLPFLEKGIVYEIAKATKGVGVILEHRYYGKSVPVPDFSTENLRFLSTDQALADTAYFAKNVQFEGLEDVDFSPDKVPWVAYGGSYAGAFVAFLRIAYPDVFFAAISSSGVPEAIWDYWEYYEAARIYGPPVCSETQGKLVDIIDNILLNDTNSDEYLDELKEAFDRADSTSKAEFANSIGGGIAGLQGYNWDPEISSDSFFTYCDTISSDNNDFPELEDKRDFVEKIVKLAGYEDELDPLVNRMLNYMGSQQNNGRVDADSLRTIDDEFMAQNDLSQTWRLWPYQVCTEWGFLQTGSGVPEDTLGMISRTIDLEYTSNICRSAFDINEPADTDIVNRFGGFNASYHRLAWVDGEWDPWRAAGVQALSQPERESTPSEPIILIDKAVHHWDENGVFPNETSPGFPPQAVVDAKDGIREFVLEWLKDWEQGKK